MQKFKSTFQTKEDYAIGGVLFLAAILTFILCVRVCLLVFWSACSSEFTATVVKFQVEEGQTMVVVEHSDGELEVLSNDDSILYTKWNSSDILFDLEEGKIYQFKTNGKRVPLFSRYRNIISVKEV